MNYTRPYLIKRDTCTKAYGLHHYECSECHHEIQTTRETIEFCWHCGVKFGPEPKKEPTPGEWWYDWSTRKIYVNKGQFNKPISLVEHFTVESHEEARANGYLMAASKKLLAACRSALQTGIPNYNSALEVSQAIAEAEKGKQ